ncbi:trehalose-6-phosphate synthase [Candidatus Parcubacteria bacterium]|nr:MAG: trehalose-6-phosphate synthase [Candidatus Parcubacteria bacterium]
MTNFQDLKDIFLKQNTNLILVADAETRSHFKKNSQCVSRTSAGGVSVALEPVVKASGGIYIGRSKTDECREILDKNNKIKINDAQGDYTLRKIFLSEKEVEEYYYGFSNQTLWPLCHVTFEKPEFRQDWFEGYKRVNQKFAEAVKQEIKSNSLIWLNDYQLSLVPKLLNKPKNSVVAFFWHIPWPTWEVFRILPFKREILESLLSCDFLAFHRGYHVRNFLETVEREFEVRIDEETNRIYYNNNITTVKSLPMGIDTDVISSLAFDGSNNETSLIKVVKTIFHLEKKVEISEENEIDELFKHNKIILGVDRLDYTKGLFLRLQAIDRFFEKNPKYIGNVSYLGILAPSREVIPSYKKLKKEVYDLSIEINKKYYKSQRNWMPIHLVSRVFERKDIIEYYKKASLCLITPRDDGMNLVSKEFVISTSFSKTPGMIILSQFAGSAIDLTRALIINPYDIDEVAGAIKKGLEMSDKEKKERIGYMVDILEEKNIYTWATEFIRSARISVKEK